MRSIGTRGIYNYKYQDKLNKTVGRAVADTTTPSVAIILNVLVEFNKAPDVGTDGLGLGGGKTLQFLGAAGGCGREAAAAADAAAFDGVAGGVDRCRRAARSTAPRVIVASGTTI
ncbi:hypothetical protein DFJ73DRAFT_774530 [Zopfochytrium polystomum]|nr:hypothetical protein DFJ73DRAFT_774530 [Zopfochytrium polystomum]